MKLRYEKTMASKVFTDPTAKIKEQYLELDIKIKRLENSAINKVKDLKTRAVDTISRLDTLSPLKTLTRGYTIAEKDGKTLKSSKELIKNDIVNLKFIDGKIETKVI